MDLPTTRSIRIKEEILKSKFFRIAREQMFQSDHHVRMGAVMVISNKQYIPAHNHLNKTHPIIERHYPEFVQSIHAELNALIRYNEVRHGKLPKRTSMYVYREEKNGTVKLAKPCKTCEKLMREAGIKKVFYSTDTGIKMEIL